MGIADTVHYSTFGSIFYGKLRIPENVGRWEMILQRPFQKLKYILQENVLRSAAFSHKSYEVPKVSS